MTFSKSDFHSESGSDSIENNSSVYAPLYPEARMTCSLVVGRLSMPVDEALGLMTERRFRHLPVVEDGKLLGLVSIGDLVKQKLSETAEEAQALRTYIAS